MAPRVGSPVPVSPLIRGARYALLFAGIIYARIKQSYYESTEAVWKEHEAVRKAARDAHMAMLKKKIAAEERATLKLLESGALFDEDRSGDDHTAVPAAPPPPSKVKDRECK